jgi:predicted RNase H-like nuclease
MQFVGVDLAWTQSGGTGLCLVEDGRVLASTRLVSDADVAAWLTPYLEDDAVVAIDAPLIVRNLTGRRPAEQLISRCFGAYHASAHSANLSLPSFRHGVRGEQLAVALDLDVDPVFRPRTRLRRAIEVYPHTAIVALFELPTTLKYKRKKGRTVESRAAELGRLLLLLESLRDFDPPLDVAASPRWPAIRGSVANAATPVELDRLEDEIDAYVCAYTALYYWSHGTERCRIAGDIETGYIVTPVTAAVRECLDRLSAGLSASRPTTSGVVVPDSELEPESRPIAVRQDHRRTRREVRKRPGNSSPTGHRLFPRQ